MKYFKYIFILILILSSQLGAQEKKTNWSFGGGILGNGNIYTSSFKQIGAIPNCCTNYSGAFALGFGILGFGEYSFKESKFPYNWKAGIGISFNDLSAEFNEIAEIGNVITGNSYTKGKSEFLIDITLLGLGIEPYLSFEVFKDIPLNIKIGTQLFIPFKKTYDQAENLISPSNATFENLSKTRNTAQADIPKFNGAILLPSIGLKYDFLKTNNFIFSGLTNFYFGIHDVVSNIDWKINYLNAGLAIKYTVPKAEVLPPIPPPEPIMPAPPKESIFTYDLKMMIDSKEIENYGNYEYHIFRDKYVYNFPVLLKMYYKYNSTEFADYETDNKQLVHQNNIKNLIFDEFTKDKNSKIKIINTYLKSEDKDIVDQRVNLFIRLFQKAFVNEFNISSIIIEENPIEDSSFDREELKEESINLSFEVISNGVSKNILNNQTKEYRNITAKEVKIQLVPIIIADAGPARFMGDLDLNGNTLTKLDNDNLSYNYKEKNLDNYKQDLPFYGVKTLRALTDVVDMESKTKSIDFQVNIEDKITDLNTYEFNSFNDSANTCIIGFFEFDQSEFSSINQHAVKEYNKAKELGYKIEIIGSTDNIGESKHNKNLAKKRFNAAVKLLNANAKDFEFQYPDNFYFDNKFPQGRAYNRSAILKVTPK